MLYLKVLSKMKRKLSILLLFLCFLTSCIIQDDQWGVGFGALPYASIDGSSESSEGPPDSEWLYIDLNESYYKSNSVEPIPYELNTTEEFKDTRSNRLRSGELSRSNCEIEYDPDLEPSESSTEDLYCVLDVMELDIYTHNLSIKYNIPTGMCDYVSISPSWHFNQKAGYGPETIYECDIQINPITDDEGNVTCEETKEYYKDGCPAETSDCTSTRGRENIEDFCAEFDKSEQDLANCCFGNYTILDSNNEPVSNEKWPGTLQQCIGGPARTSWDLFDPNYDSPLPYLKYTLEEGFSNIFTIQSIEQATGGLSRASVPVANFVQTLNTRAGSIPGRVQDLHEGEGPLAEAVGFKPRPFFSIECLDPAREVVHALYLMVREWNTAEDFFDYIIEKGSTEDNSDVSGKEGQSCAYEEDRLSTLFGAERL